MVSRENPAKIVGKGRPRGEDSSILPSLGRLCWRMRGCLGDRGCYPAGGGVGDDRSHRCFWIRQSGWRRWWSRAPGAGRR